MLKFVGVSDCWAIRRTHVIRLMHSTSGVCVCCLASNGTNLYRTIRRLIKQPKLTAIIQSRRLTLFGHINDIIGMDDNADLLASPPADWRRQLSRPRITWLSTVQQDLNAPRSSTFGSEPPSVEDDVDVWRYAIELHARN